MNIKRIKDYPNYLVTGEGKIYSIKNRIELKQFSNGCGYWRVDLYNNKGRKRTYIHRLVAIAFIPNPLNKPIVNHIDEDPSNNDKSNLNWMTVQENVLWSITKEVD